MIQDQNESEQMSSVGCEKHRTKLIVVAQRRRAKKEKKETTTNENMLRNANYITVIGQIAGRRVLS